MKRVMEFTGKNVSEAIEEGIKKLGVSADDVDIKIISQGGFFKKAKVELTYEDGMDAARIEKEKQLIQKAQESALTKPKNEQKSAPAAEKKSAPAAEQKSAPVLEHKPAQKTENKPFRAERENSGVNSFSKEKQAFKKPEFKNNPNENKRPAEKDKKRFERPVRSAPVSAELTKVCTDFLSGILGHMGLEATLEAKEDNGLNIEIITSDSTIIGYRGEVLDALQFLTSLVLNEAGGRHVQLSIDALGYRDKRIETLKALARKMADKCVNLNKRVSLEPMRSSDRRIIHAELQDNENVFTRSEGNEPARRIVIMPAFKTKKNQNAPVQKTESNDKEDGADLDAEQQ